jgi:ADP-dependent phosphofructokinase/glucokinase
MAENTFKANQESSSKETSGKSLFSGIEQRLRLERYFEAGFPVRHLPRFAFIFLLGLIYIGNTHYAEQTIRDINRAQTDVEDLRADFTTLKAELMFASKQSEVARKVIDQGLEESMTPPFKIEIDPDEY